MEKEKIFTPDKIKYFTKEKEEYIKSNKEYIEYLKQRESKIAGEPVATFRNLIHLNIKFHEECIFVSEMELGLVKSLAEIEERLIEIESILKGTKEPLKKLQAFDDFLKKAEEYHKNLEEGGRIMYGDQE